MTVDLLQLVCFTADRLKMKSGNYWRGPSLSVSRIKVTNTHNKGSNKVKLVPPIRCSVLTLTFYQEQVAPLQTGEDHFLRSPTLRGK